MNDNKHGMCYVNWCASYAASPDGACMMHRRHPVRHSLETREQWSARIYYERPRRQAEAPEDAPLGFEDVEKGVELPGFTKS